MCFCSFWLYSCNFPFPKILLLLLQTLFFLFVWSIWENSPRLFVVPCTMMVAGDERTINFRHLKAAVSYMYDYGEKRKRRFHSLLFSAIWWGSFLPPRFAFFFFLAPWSATSLFKTLDLLLVWPFWAVWLGFYHRRRRRHLTPWKVQRQKP